MTIIEFLSSLHDISLELRAKINLTLHLVAVYQGRELRDSGEFVLEHPCDVMRQLMDMHMPEEVIIAGGLHDMIEDTKITFEDIAEHFGQEIARMVSAVSKKPKDDFPDPPGKSARLAEMHTRWIAEAKRNFYVIFIKVADRLHNLETLHGLERKDPSKVERIATETLEFYVPFLRGQAKEIVPEKYHHYLKKYADKMELLAKSSLINIHANNTPV
jgi:guanosine-3',5'-bis(diphosphate) 3'-pyrophosphohydrolase